MQPVAWANGIPAQDTQWASIAMQASNMSLLIQTIMHMHVSSQEAKRLMEVNYLGPYMVTQGFLPVLIKQVRARPGVLGLERLHGSAELSCNQPSPVLL